MVSADVSVPDFWIVKVSSIASALPSSEIFTAFKLENVHVIYNGDKELEVGDIRTSSSETAEILPDDRQITEVKISGEIFNGRKFSGTFSGLVNNDTLLTVDMDEDFSLFVTSNIDNFDY